MIKKQTLLTALIALLSLTIIGFAQTGTFNGTVFDAEGTPVAGAEIELFELGGCGGGGGGMGGGGGGMGGGGGGMSDPLYETETSEDGTFIIELIDADEYRAMAHAEELGGDMEEIEIIAGETLTVEFTLEGCSGGGGGGGGGAGGGCGGWANLVTVELEGTAMVEDSCTMSGMYFLDIDGDDVADYQLNFGPPWYDPQSGAERPEDGDFIEIVGGLNEISVNQMVLVYEINGLFWRDPLGTNPGDLRRLRERRNISGDMVEESSKIEMSSHPNPFNPETTISYTLSDAAMVNIAVYNSLGQRIATLLDGNQTAGAHQVEWKAGQYSSGFYFVQMNVQGQTFTQRLLLTK